MNFGIHNAPSQNTVLFCRKATNTSFGFNKNVKKSDEANSQKLFLLSKHCEFSIFENIPKKFTISTKTSTCNFNLEMLKETSPVITKFVKDNPDETNYFLNINDEENVLRKFEQLFLGKTVFFDEDEVPTSQRITKMLKIKNCPNYLKPESLKTSEIDSNGNSFFSSSTNMNSGVEIYQKYFINYLNKPGFQTFRIKTKRKEYKCNTFGIYSSDVIRQIIDKDPKTEEYFYDYEDEYDEFQAICDFINFKKVDITSNNMDSIKEIAEDLQINCIMKQIDNYINNYEKFSQKIDEQQTIIDTIDQLFDSLINIKTLGIEAVKISILQSKWPKSEENIQELAAFILQIIKPDISLQQEMAELLIQLNKEANETNKLHILIPFLVDKLMSFYMSNNSIQNKISPISFGSKFSTGFGAKPSTNTSITLNNKYVYSFIRILYKKGIIPKEKIIEKLKNCNCQNKLLNAFFLPEIIESNPKNANLLTSYNSYSYSTVTDNFILFIKKYLPDKVDLYEKMLDSMEPDDELTKSIIHDDVDTLQTIITRNEIDISSFKVPYNIFDDIEETLDMINYAALCGSIKSFKYLLLNNGIIDERTLYFAVFGGNIEIIKIVDQRSTNDIPINNNQNKTSFSFNNNNSNIFWFKINNNNNNNNSGFGMSSNNGIDNDEIFQYSKIINSRDVSCLNYSNINNIIAPTIALHRNELFDWIFEKLFVSKGKIGNALEKIALLSASTGNAHSLIEMIDKGFDISSVSSRDIIYSSARNGFCQLTQLLLGIIDQKLKKSTIKFTFDTSDYLPAVNFGNLSIFKLFIKQMNQMNLEGAINYAITMDYKKIIHYFFDNLSQFNFTVNASFAHSVLSSSFKKNTDDCFNFLMNELKQLNPDLFELSFYVDLLDFSCLYSNLPATKTITDYILNEDPKKDFSSAFIKASSSGSMNICQYFIDKKVYINYNQLSTRVSELGSIDEELFLMIINNVNPSIKYKFLKCIDQAILKKNKKLITFLLNEKAPIKDALFNAVSTRDLEIVDLILSYNSKPSFINQKKSFGTAIHVAVNNKDLDIVKRLLSVPGIDPSLNNQQDENPLSSAILSNEYEIFDALISFFEDKIDKYIWIIINIFQVMNNHCFFGNQQNKTPWKILKRIMSIKSINPNYYEQCTFLYKACLFDEVEIVEFLLSLEKIDVNKYETSSYNTPLMIAIEKKNTRIVQLLLDHPETDINSQNIYDETALIIAVKTNQKDIVDLLIKDKRFDPYESRLNFAFIYANIEISKQLISLSSLDVNQEFEVEKNKNHRFGQSEILFSEINSLTKSVQINDIEKIDLIINHSSFDKNISDFTKSIFTAAKENNTIVFRKLIQLINNDINIHNTKNTSLLVLAAKKLSGDIIDEIFNNPQFDPKSDQICQAFVESYSSKSQFNQINPPMWPHQNQNRANANEILNAHLIPPKSSVIEIMNKILNYDEEHEHLIDFKQLLPNGKSFFTSIHFNFDEIGLVSDFLIEHGADPNMPDKNGLYPLENAIMTGSLDFVTSLVNSNKIIYDSKLTNDNTYLHLAARNSNSQILGFLLDKNVIDINSTNYRNETPLMEACRMKLSENVNLLFNADNLDYLHLNKFGKDALSIIKSLPQNEVNDAKKSRETYHNKINSLLATSAPSFGFGQNNFGFNNQNNFGFNNHNNFGFNNNDQENKEEEEED